MSRFPEFAGRLNTTPKPVLITADEAAMPRSMASAYIIGRMNAKRRRAATAYQEKLAEISREEDEAIEEHSRIEAARCAEEYRLKQPGCRKRRPLDLNFWKCPPGTSSETLEAKIDAICGCAGCFDCDCISVFNKAKCELWMEYHGK